MVASSRQQNFTEKQYYFKQLIDNWRTVLMIHRLPSLAVPMILVRKVKRSQEQHLCTYFDFNQTSPIGLDSSVTASQLINNTNCLNSPPRAVFRVKLVLKPALSLFWLVIIECIGGVNVR